EGQVLCERGIRWIQAGPAAEQRGLRFDLALLLYDAGHWDEERQILSRIAAEKPNDMDVQVMRGTLAARQGELKQVARIDRWLAQRADPYLRGAHTFHRARL